MPYILLYFHTYSWLCSLLKAFWELPEVFLENRLSPSDILVDSWLAQALASLLTGSCVHLRNLNTCTWFPWFRTGLGDAGPVLAQNVTGLKPWVFWGQFPEPSSDWWLLGAWGCSQIYSLPSDSTVYYFETGTCLVVQLASPELGFQAHIPVTVRDL